MKSRILGATLLLAGLLAVGCSRNQNAGQTSGTNAADTTNANMAQNNANNTAPVAGTGAGYPTTEQREREARSLPPGTAVRTTTHTTTRRHARNVNGGTYGNNDYNNMPPSGEAAPPAPAGPQYVSVPAGQSGSASLDSPLSSETTKEGDTFTATLNSDWMADGRTAVPAGTKVLGHVSQVNSAGRGKSKALLVLAFDRLGLPNGRTVDISAKPETFEAAGDTKGDVAKIGGGTLIGGIIGSVTGNTKKGAAIGAVVGTGAALASRGKPVDLAAGHTLQVVLTSDARVPVGRTRS